VSVHQPQMEEKVEYGCIFNRSKNGYQLIGHHWSQQRLLPVPPKSKAWKNAGMVHQNPCLGEGPVGVHCPDSRSFPHM
jgi:hypothetical protein